jgi:hypothetical protein
VAWSQMTTRSGVARKGGEADVVVGVVKIAETG